ncbi:exonuclease domain-containing protein [Yinghuangia soli]|uniref:Exonuclease domain-containing protein n=1 Tax=Yinghuangia soli TaxID=2908204 RepID=A0AA41Q4U7_9ACTN|nr:exonuclease domain-containing protein [Yinghuangia soli]MCF2531232.1 hypothetical protein [Yinghuangia soli]
MSIHGSGPPVHVPEAHPVPGAGAGDAAAPGSGVPAADSTVPAHAARNASGRWDHGTPLDRQVFVVVDLETTGLSAEADRITEIAAVRLRGSDVLGEFATLVAPGVPVPAFITALTGISDAMLADAPPLHHVLPAFHEFARDAVLVAHNAPFDIGFLRAACAACGEPWPHLVVVDTLELARALVSRGEVANYKLGTLARLFDAPQPAVHRAAADARATAHILRSLIARLQRAGVHDLSGLLRCTGHPGEPQAV